MATPGLQSTLIFLLLAVNCCAAEDAKQPTVTIAFLARNAAINLPWFLGGIENLDYPKDRITIWCRTDHNEDDTAQLLQTWRDAVNSQYHAVNISYGPNGRYADENNGVAWTSDRYQQVVQWRQEALDIARLSWSDYIFMVDSDVLIYDRNLLDHLMDAQVTLIAPMLNSSSLYSNFWGETTEDGYYKRSDDYLDILDGRKMGRFHVPMIHSAILLNLRHRASENINYHPPHPKYARLTDDIMQLAFSSKINRVPMYLTNEHYYGHLIVPDNGNQEPLQRNADIGLYIRLHHIAEGLKLEPTTHIPLPPTRFKQTGFGKVFMINLERRPERGQMMDDLLKELGIEYQYFAAVDGRKLNDSYLDSIGVKQMEGYLDPYHKRPMKYGEIGCFLSHYFIWKEMEEKGYKRILILEDDVRFKLNFIQNFYNMMAEADLHINGWDLLYIGRKIMLNDEEFVPNAHHLVYPGYTYWTLSYALSQSGMKKLLDQKPLAKMIPVDEYLPIMFDAHSNTEWKSHFSPRDVIALSANPLLVEPLRYIGETGYVSDTEDSAPIVALKQDASQFEKAGARKMSTSDDIPRHKGPEAELHQDHDEF